MNRENMQLQKPMQEMTIEDFNNLSQEACFNTRKMLLDFVEEGMVGERKPTFISRVAGPDTFDNSGLIRQKALENIINKYNLSKNATIEDYLNTLNK